jgi:hypothetical protein
VNPVAEADKQPQLRPVVVIATVLCVVVAVAFILEGGSFFPMSFFSSSSDRSGRFVPPSVPLAPPPVVSKAKYDSISEGMSYEQVKGIIGASGEELSRSDLAGIKTVMYQWMNPNGSNMNAMFQNGKLIQKAQFGLP